MCWATTALRIKETRIMRNENHANGPLRRTF
jgi:hypothetical protein